MTLTEEQLLYEFSIEPTSQVLRKAGLDFAYSLEGTLALSVQLFGQKRGRVLLQAHDHKNQSVAELNLPPS